MQNPRLKKRIKNGLALILHYSGLGQRVLRNRTAGKCLTLMYHRILPPEMLGKSPSNDAIQLATRTFQKQLAFLATRFEPITLKELSGHLRDKAPLTGNRLMITFDDGWKDNHDHALPLLQKYRLPAVIFISTGFVGSAKRFWQEKLNELLRDAPSADANARRELADLLAEYNPAFLNEKNRQQRREMLVAMIQRIKGFDYGRIEDIVLRIETWSRRHNLISDVSPNDQRDFLGWDEIARMQRAGIEFGSHGVDHRILTKEGVDVAHELRQSKQEMETRLGIPTLSISYPNGDCSREVMNMAAAAGYHLGFGTRFGYNDHQSDAFQLRRININAAVTDTIPLFVGRLLGLW